MCLQEQEEGVKYVARIKQGLTYRDAGVDIDAGNKAVELMKESVKKTYTAGVVGDLGGFGGYALLSRSFHGRTNARIWHRRCWHKIAPRYHDG